jgi:hypothetical protein
MPPSPPQSGHVGPWNRASSAARGKDKKAQMCASFFRARCFRFSSRFFFFELPRFFFFAFPRFFSFALASAKLTKSAGAQL